MSGSVHRIVRKMGYIRDQEGIMNRFFREGDRWEPHLVKTRDFITGAFTDRTVRSIAVLGSGWLIDFPLEELVDRFDSIILVDIHHPPQVRHRVKSMENVILQENDLTGGAVDFCLKLKTEIKDKKRISLAEGLVLNTPELVIDPDAMISLNLLSQLDIFLVDYLKADKYFQHHEIEHFRRIIQKFHIDWIIRKPGCLITDTKEINIDKKGNKITKSLLFTPLPEGIRSERWLWEFDLNRTYRPGMQTTLEIQAIEW